MTSTGKIARLPKYIRDQINQRLDDAQSANEILRWLNQLPESQEMLAEKFGSRPITRQNLSQWKAGGYQTWLRVQQTREQVQTLFEYAQDLETDDSDSLNADGMTFADRLGALVAVQLLTAIQKLDDITDPDQRWQRLTGIVSQLSRLRREDHHGRRVRLAEEQWSDKCGRQEEQDEKDAKEAKKTELRTWFYSIGELKKDAEFLGGGEFGEKWADWLRRLECDLPRPAWWRGPWINHARPEPVDGGHSPSSPKPAQSAPPQERRAPARPDRLSKPRSPTRRNAKSCKVNQSKSNQQPAKVPNRASPAGQPNRAWSRRSLSEDGSKSNQPCDDVPTAAETVSDRSAGLQKRRDSNSATPELPNPSKNSAPSDANPSTCDPRAVPPSHPIPPLDTRHPPPK